MMPMTKNERRKLSNALTGYRVLCTQESLNRVFAEVETIACRREKQMRKALRAREKADAEHEGGR